MKQERNTERKTMVETEEIKKRGDKKIINHTLHFLLLLPAALQITALCFLIPHLPCVHVFFHNPPL